LNALVQREILSSRLRKSDEKICMRGFRKTAKKWQLSAGMVATLARNGGNFETEWVAVVESRAVILPIPDIISSKSYR
jgi:hypothetical protein